MERAKRLVPLTPGPDWPDDETLWKHVLEPTGNLWAPTIRKGTTRLVGFDARLYRKHLG